MKAKKIIREKQRGRLLKHPP